MAVTAAGCGGDAGCGGGLLAFSVPHDLRDPTIRPAQPRDTDALGRLGEILVRAHQEFDARRFLAAEPGTAEGYAGFLRSQLAAPDAVILVAERDGAVIGYAYGTMEGHDWMSLRGPAGMIHDLVVDPAARGGGIGSALLEAMLEALERRGAPQVVLMTAERNPGAQRLFARAGFRRTMIEMTRDADAR